MSQDMNGSALCADYDHPATLQRTSDGQVLWLVRPRRCHIATEVYDAEAAAFLNGSYVITSGCRPDVLHGDLIEDAPQAAVEAPVSAEESSDGSLEVQR